MNQFTKNYAFETSVGYLFNLYLGISFFRMYAKYSDVLLKNCMWRQNLDTKL
jgi:hypothetical protein